MRLNRGITVAVVAVLCAGGCASKQQASRISAVRPSADAAARLLAAAAKSGRTSLHFVADDGSAAGSIEGTADPAAPAAATTLTAELDQGDRLVVHSLAVGGAVYLKMTGLPGLDLPAQYWYRADATKLTTAADFGVFDAKDPLGLAGLMSGLAAVRRADATHFAGTIDLTRVTSGPLHDEDLVTGLGERAKAVPFEAAVDGAGYLTSMKVSVPAYGDEPASASTVTLSDFGRPAPLSAPAPAEVKDLPPTVYAALNGAP